MHAILNRASRVLHIAAAMFPLVAFASAARVSTPILDHSKVGFILTNGDPTGASQNSVIGGDFQFRDPTLIPDKEFGADAFFQHSFSNTVGGDNAFGFGLNFPNEPWYGNFKFKKGASK
jgi:hypothetical protein